MAIFAKTEIDLFLVENENYNTVRKSRGDMNLLRTFMKLKEINEQIEKMDYSLLNNLLWDFFINIRKPDSSQYETNTLRSMFSSFKRYLDSKNYGQCLISSPFFEKCRKCLFAKQKSLNSEGKGNSPNAARAITEEEVGY